jgi:hypothetical protein
MVWFNFDPCGMVCAFVTHALLVYAQYVVTYVILLPWFEMSVEGAVHQVHRQLAPPCRPAAGLRPAAAGRSSSRRSASSPRCRTSGR